MTKLTLTSNQSERAKNILENLDENGRIQKSLLPEWQEAMSWEQFNQRIDADVYEKSSENKVRKWVPASDIVGPLGGTADPDEKFQSSAQDVKSGRLEKIIGWMTDGEFEIDYDDYDLPHYVEFDGKFYVTQDGRHRSIACKAVGIEKIWGEVSVIR